MRKFLAGMLLTSWCAFAALFSVADSSGDKSGQISGVIYSKNEAALSSKNSGFLKTILVEAGEVVKEGQVLFEIDQNEALALLNAAKSNHDEALNNLKRYKTLFEKGVISQNELERVEVDYENKKALYRQGENTIKYAIVRAPFSGMIAKKNFSVGSFVSAGQPIVVLQSTKDLRFKASVGEASARAFAVGQSVVINANHKDYEVKILSITNIAPMSYEIRAQILKPDGLFVGQYCSLLSKTQDVSTSVLPISVITKRGGIIGVFANENSKAKFYPLQIVQENADSVLVKGVKSGMKLVVLPKASLVDGAKVE